MAKSTVGIYLAEFGTPYVQFPVNPESIEVTSPFAINTVNIASLGEVALLGERGTKTVSFSSFFPKFYNSSYCEYQNLEAPTAWIERIENLRDSRNRMQLVIAGTKVTISCYISDFTYSPEEAGSPGDIYYSISFVEAKSIYSTNILPPVSNVTSPPVDASKAKTPTSKTYTVVKGDTLSAISRKQYGSSAQWNRIYNANLKVIGKNPNLIYPGQRLVIP